MSELDIVISVNPVEIGFPSEEPIQILVPFSPQINVEVSEAKVGGAGAGDMTKAVYDPTGVEDDAFDVDNHVSGTVNKVFSATEQSKLAGIQVGAEVNTASNYGTGGIGLYHGKTGANLEFKNIKAGSAKISVTDDVINNNVDIDLGTVTADDITDGTTYKRFSATEQSKLSGIAAGAEVNVNADWNSVSGDSQIMNKPLEFAPSDHASGHVTGGGDVIADAIAGGNSGLMSGADKTKLNGIAEGAEVNVNADWNAGSGDAQILNKPTIPTQYTDELAQDAVGGMATGSLAYNDATPSLQLTNDSVTPGNNKVYGTDGAGTKGWKNDPSGAGFTEGSHGITIDGSGSTITTGHKGYFTVPQNCTITGWTIVAKSGETTASIVIDVKKCTYAAFPTTASIAGTEKPTLATAQKNQDLTLTTWTTSLLEGDILEYVVDSASNITRVNLFLKLEV